MPRPLAPSESVDAFLTWLAQPTNAVSVHPGHGHAHVHGHTHHIGPGSNTAGLGFVPQKAKVSEKEREYAARLRELARSPLEDMAKPLLAGTVAISRSHSTGAGKGGKAQHGKEGKKEKSKSTGSGNATPTKDAHKMKNGAHGKA